MKLLFTNNRPKLAIYRLLLGCLIASLHFYAQSAVLVKDKLWTNGSVLNVVFLDGSLDLQKQVMSVAPLWLEDTGLAFNFYSDRQALPQQTHIRVSFNSHSGSRLGDHNEYTSEFATMNLNDLIKQPISSAAAKRLILHEFGHALGLEHEYRNQHWPYGKSALDQVISECYPKMQTIGYNRADAIKRCKTINSTLDKNRSFATAYDERSIMNYAFTFVQANGLSKTIKANYQLSLLDRYAIQRWYPK